VSFYPPKINEKFSAPKNVGKLENETALGTGATFVCGAVLRLYLRVDLQSKEILEAKFRTSGCGYAVASADILADAIVGKKLVELHGFDDDALRNKIESELGAFEIQRRHCLNLALDGLRNAFANFRARQIEEFSGEKALICTCFGVSEETIENLIKTKSLETVEQVTEICNAGGGCGSCQPLIEDILDVCRREEFY
jgi:NifU-like protein